MTTFQPGDKTILVDLRHRRYLVTLQTGGVFHFHRGMVAHDEIIGKPDGFELTSSGGEKMAVFLPTYAEYVLKMRRGAQIIYPKDVAMIVLYADIYPGARVLEAGVGSGALTIGLLRAVGSGGQVTAYDVREDFIQTARENIQGFLGKAECLEIRTGDVCEAIDPELEVDRVVFDLPEPWRALVQVKSVLRFGGILICYLPTILQVGRLVEALRQDAAWTALATTETLNRTWHVEGQSIRPDHRMVAHTGFITVARLISR